MYPNSIIKTQKKRRKIYSALSIYSHPILTRIKTTTALLRWKRNIAFHVDHKCVVKWDRDRKKRKEKTYQSGDYFLATLLTMLIDVSETGGENLPELIDKLTSLALAILQNVIS